MLQRSLLLASPPRSLENTNTNLPTIKCAAERAYAALNQCCVWVHNPYRYNSGSCTCPWQHISACPVPDIPAGAARHVHCTTCSLSRQHEQLMSPVHHRLLISTFWNSTVQPLVYSNIWCRRLLCHAKKTQAGDASHSLAPQSTHQHLN